MAHTSSRETDSGQPTIDVANFIDAQPVVRFQIRLLLLCASVLFMDGFDTQAIGYVAPAVAREWNVQRGALAPVFSAGLFGLMIGALTFGPLADRVGRKWIIVFSTAAFGAGAVATSFAENLTGLMVLRFLTGLGLGGAMPNAIALTSEFSPHRHRATMIMVMFCGFSIGAALGGLLAAALIPTFGWRSVFLVGGVAPLLYTPVLVASLPESVRFLALTGRQDARAGDLLRAIAPSTSFTPGTRFRVHEPKLPGLPITHLFQEGRTGMTVLFWVMFFMSLLDLYLLANWLPTVLADLGATVSVAAAVGSMLQVGGVIGTLALGRVIDRFSFGALAVVYFLAAIAVTAVGFSGHSILLATLAIFCAGFCIVGGQTASNALTATSYPTAIRSTGVGWALGIGRIGSIVGTIDRRHHAGAPCRRGNAVQRRRDPGAHRQRRRVLPEPQRRPGKSAAGAGYGRMSETNSFERMLAILSLFTEDRLEWTSEALMKRLGYSRPTLYRYLKTLKEHGFLVGRPNVGFTLGPKVVEMDFLLRRSDPLVLEGRATLARLAARYPCTTFLARWYGDKVLCVVSEQSATDLTSSYPRGRPMPIGRGATSRAILAFLPRRQLMPLIESQLAEFQAIGLGDAEAIADQAGRGAPRGRCRRESRGDARRRRRCGAHLRRWHRTDRQPDPDHSRGARPARGAVSHSARCADHRGRAQPDARRAPRGTSAALAR